MRLHKRNKPLYYRVVVLLIAIVISYITPGKIWSSVQDLNDPVARIYAKMKIDSIRQVENRILNLYGEKELIEPETQVYEIYRAIGDTLSIDYCTTSYGLSYLHFLVGEASYSSRLGEESLRLYHKIGVNLPQLYTGILSVLGGSYFQLGQYRKAIEIYEINKQLLKDMPSSQTEVYALLLSDLAQLYTQVEDYYKAKENSAECISLLDKNQMQSTFAYLNALNAEGAIGRATGDYASAQSAYEEAIDLLSIMPTNVQTQKMFQLVASNLSWIYHMMGDNNKAIEFIDKLMQQIEDFNDINKAVFYQNSAQILMQSLDMSEMRNDYLSESFKNTANHTIEYQKKAIDIHSNLFGNESEEYLLSMSALAGIYGNFAAFDEVIEIESQIDSICSKQNALIGSKPHRLALFHLLSCHLCRYGFDQRHYSNQNEIQLSAKYADKLMEIMKSSNDDGVSPLSFFDQCAYAYIGNGERAKAFEPLKISFQRRKQRLRTNAINIADDALRNSYWDYTTNSLLTPFGVFEAIQNEDYLAPLLYDIILLYKGAKLTLASNDNPDIIFDCSWEHIKNSLHSDEIAIEFVRIQPTTDGWWNPNIKEPFYIALSIKEHEIEPSITYLCLEKELLSIDNSDRYIKDDIYKLIWYPLINKLTNVSKVFFSPMGELNNIAIEYVPTDDKAIIIGSHYEMYRLTSTRNLINRGTIKLFENTTALFGGMKYSESPDILKYQENDFEPRNLSRSCIEDLKKRKGFVDLNPATFNEVVNISAMLESNSHPNMLFTGQNASESAFRSLSNLNIGQLHIATHGFFWDDYPTYINQNSFTEFNNTKDIYVEDESMLRSGLIFSGANSYLKEGNNFGSGDNGIMTAFEISNMSLESVDLAVLSACQTGLGEVHGEGVYGLQRAFKIAGVNSLLISLWEVDNEATQMLMEAFYRSLIKGNSKRQALIEAQNTVRNTSGFEDPEYWAAFVLLDALN